MAKLGPHTRTTNPVTSDLAGQRMDAKEQRRKQALIVAKLVRMKPGMTSNELAELAKTPSKVRHRIARRLPDAEKLGLVRRAPARPDHYTGRLGLTWVPVI